MQLISDPRNFLKEYVAKHGGPAPSEGVPDLPDFTVDQRFSPLEEPPYRV